MQILTDLLDCNSKSADCNSKSDSSPKNISCKIFEDAVYYLSKLGRFIRIFSVCASCACQRGRKGFDGGRWCMGSEPGVHHPVSKVRLLFKHKSKRRLRSGGLTGYPRADFRRLEGETLAESDDGSLSAGVRILKAKHRLRSEKPMKQCFRTGVRFSSSPPEGKRQCRWNRKEDACGVRTAGVFFSCLYIGFDD